MSDEFIENLKNKVCPGIKNVMPQFLERVQATVNKMINKSTKNCTTLLNEALEEGDFSNIESYLYRCHREMKRCRFYLNIQFLPESFTCTLDEKTVSEINRYWKEIRGFLVQLAEESGSEDVYDLLYYVNRLIKKDKKNGELHSY
ncbi:hypothetical protein [Blautia wexlerae]|uniref:Uncharacterized protein n=1 Tax=Blautia wexlerae TaxID=418240 RepID=A0A6L8T1B0_9FIRM|nr:hypothetical protein [Blautia wexlerae]MZL32933.1 hypothetical protein [Blautia wexlerae]MZT14825.1 hypothetical protein [Blautia wexlerae]MZT33015.1 hypothetical protein [Blautia wexlerae]MZT40698.1 hypothetical protein [Blautia wexlerae]MZT44896.1 hypothetical protein [Blautia wexlerae]